MKVYSYIDGCIKEMWPHIHYNENGVGTLIGYVDPLDEFRKTYPIELFEILKFSLWHDGKEVPETGRIFYESDESNTGVGDYRRDIDRFDSDDETYYGGSWKRVHIKRWIYEKDLLAL